MTQKLNIAEHWNYMLRNLLEKWEENAKYSENPSFELFKTTWKELKWFSVHEIWKLYQEQHMKNFRTHQKVDFYKIGFKIIFNNVFIAFVESGS